MKDLSFSRRLLRVPSPLALLAATALVSTASALSPEDLQKRLASGDSVLIVDIRPQIDYVRATIPGAINIPARLLDRRELPKGRDIVLLSDGLGLQDAAAAAATLRARGYSRVDALEGGFLGWQSVSTIDTQGPGLSKERLPVVTYDQLMAGSSNVALLDVRQASGAATATEGVAARGGSSDLLGGFAAKLGGVPVLRPTVASARPATAGAGTDAATISEDAAVTLANAASALADDAPADRLLVIVADDARTADETARRLRSGGQRRFAVLVGGTDAIAREGKPGLDRLGASLDSLQPQP